MTTQEFKQDGPQPSSPAPCSQFDDTMAMRSLQLQELLRSHHFRKGDGVSGAGLALVTRLAKQRGGRDWPHTRTVADYDLLIRAVTDHFANEKLSV
jgi:hypothetical protein